MSKTHNSSATSPRSGKDAQHSLYDELLCTVLMAGYSPVAPGTAGALVATVLWCIAAWAGVPHLWLQLATLVLVVGITLLSIPSIRRLEADWGEDPSRVVVDEAVGVWIALLAAPASLHWGYALAAFVLFRLFDITKPLGIRRMEAVRGGWGVMLDDIVAGLYSAVLILLFQIVRGFLA